MAEVKETRLNFKTAIMVLITIPAITKVIMDSSIMHEKVTIKVMDTANLGAEAVTEAEVITLHVATAGITLEAIITITICSTIAMIMILPQSNMVQHALYVVDITILQNIVSRENMISITSWKR